MSSLGMHGGDAWWDSSCYRIFQDGGGICNIFWASNHKCKCTDLLLLQRTIPGHNLFSVSNLTSLEMGHRRFPDDAITLIFADTGMR